MNDAWHSRVNAEARPLTAQIIRDAVATMREHADARRLEQADRMAAWASLNLDYKAMSSAEQLLVAYAFQADAIHPREYEQVREIVERYRRDG